MISSLALETLTAPLVRVLDLVDEAEPLVRERGENERAVWVLARHLGKMGGTHRLLGVRLGTTRTVSFLRGQGRGYTSPCSSATLPPRL